MSFKKKGPSKGEMSQLLKEKVNAQGAAMADNANMMRNLNQGLVQTMQHLQQLQQEMGTMVLLTTRYHSSTDYATDEDFVVIDCVGRVCKEDGSLDYPFEGGKLFGFAADLSRPEGFIPGFTEKLIGLGTGEQFDFKITFPEEYQNKDLAGVNVNFRGVALKVFKPVENAHLVRDLVTELEKEKLDAQSTETEKTEES